MKDLGLGGFANGLPVASGRAAEAGGGDPGVAEGDGEGGRGGNILGQMKGIVGYHYIYDRIDEALDYPSELKEAGIGGVVRAELFFSPEGKFLTRASRIESGSRFLRVLVIRLLRHVFAGNLPATFTRGGRAVRCRCLFEFELIKGDDFALDTGTAVSGIGVMGNHLAFHRTAGVFGEWKLGPFAGNIRSLMSGALAVDPGWFVDQAEKLTSNKARIDPLQKYRDDPDW